MPPIPSAQKSLALDEVVFSTAVAVLMLPVYVQKSTTTEEQTSGMSSGM